MIEHRGSDLGLMKNQNMKKMLIILVNVIIMSAILIFVVFYSRFTGRDSYHRQIEHFEDTTVSLYVTRMCLKKRRRI